MLKVDQVNSIICLINREGKSYAETAKILGLDPRTVKKYSVLDDHSYKVQTRQKSAPVMDPVKPIIDQWLFEDMKVPRKQRHTARRIYDRLCEEYEFNGSQRSVRQYVRLKKQEIYAIEDQENYLPLTGLPGEAQFDFGEVVVVYEGQEVTMQEAVITFPHSNAGFSQLFFGNNQECVLESLKRVFNFISGVPKRILFDNLTPVVHKDKDNKKVLTEGVQRFANHYGFNCGFCNAAKGNEKGNVENKVGYIRRNWYTPIPQFRNRDELESFNKMLFDKAIKDMNRSHYTKGKSIATLWEEDLTHCHSLPSVEYECFKLEQCKTDKRGLVHIETNHYSTRPDLVCQKIWAKVYHDRIAILDHQYHTVCEHPRLYARNTRLIDWSMYLQSLKKKPNALYNTDFYHVLPEHWQRHLNESNDIEKLLGHMEVLLKVNHIKYPEEIAELFRHLDCAIYDNTFIDNADNAVKSNLQRPLPQLPPYDPDLSVYGNLLPTGGDAA